MKTYFSTFNYNLNPFQYFQIQERDPIDGIQKHSIPNTNHFN
jgi:hypothetical protein